MRHQEHQEESATMRLMGREETRRRVTGSWVRHTSRAEPSPFDELDGPEGFVHVPDSQEEGEVEHGVLRGLVTVF